MDNDHYSPIEIVPHSYQRPLIDDGLFDQMLAASGTKARFAFKLSRLQSAMLTVAAVFLAAGIYLAAINWHSSKAPTVSFASLGTLKAAADIASSTGQAPSTAPVSASALQSYRVAPALPRYLIIPRLGVDARVMSVGVTSSGNIGTPDDIYDTAWYNGSAEPGMPGATVIDGHISSWSAKGVFYNLGELKPGDTIQIERGDGTMLTYKVVRSQLYPSGNVDMQSALTPVIAGSPGLNLITCAGHVIAGTSEFNQRLVVYSSQVSG